VILAAIDPKTMQKRVSKFIQKIAKLGLVVVSDSTHCCFCSLLLFLSHHIILLLIRLILKGGKTAAAGMTASLVLMAQLRLTHPPKGSFCKR
jgi:hypothetical protein